MAVQQKVPSFARPKVRRTRKWGYWGFFDGKRMWGYECLTCDSEVLDRRWTHAEAFTAACRHAKTSAHIDRAMKALR
jgi:hypothetical protein